MNHLFKNRLLSFFIIALSVGQVLYFFGFTTLFIIALVGVLAVGVPYPSIIRSLPSRFAAGFLLAFSVIQVAAAVQFFAFPNSGFRTLSLLTSLLVLGLIFIFRPKRVTVQKRLVIWDKKDMAAFIVALFFVIPFGVLCLWGNNPLHITAFAGTQSPDGVSHYIAIAEMDGSQRLNYRTVQYYPKGFHLASAFFMHGLHANQRDLNWLMNARVYIGMYVLWGSLLGYEVFYLSRQLLDGLVEKQRSKQIPNSLLALTIGPIVSLIYLLPFAYDGFINYYYICASVSLGLLFLYDYLPNGKDGDWFMIAYLILVFGVSMSWGPLLAPALLLIPVLYLMPGTENLQKTMKQLLSRRHWWVIVAFVLQLVPFYLHFKYAKLNSAQGINAQGIIRDFHFRLIIAGEIILMYIAFGNKVSEVVRRFALNVLLPFYLLVGLLVALQLFTAGEVRYYSIKTSYLLELILIALLGALLLYAAFRSSLTMSQQWLVAPVMLGVGILILLGGATTNPLLPVRQLFRQYSRFGKPSFYNLDTQKYTELGTSGKLDGTNNETLHYDITANKIYGNSLIGNWANVMQYSTDNTPESAKCSGSIFSVLAYGAGSPDEQIVLTQAIKDCIAQAFIRHQPYYIITDYSSAAYLRKIFGNEVTYIY